MEKLFECRMCGVVYTQRSVIRQLDWLHFFRCGVCGTIHDEEEVLEGCLE